jgi:type 1 glutamine amidotransferase
MGISNRLVLWMGAHIGVGLILIQPLASHAAFKVLVLAGTSGDHSPMSSAGRPVLEKLGAANGFTVDYFTDVNLLTDANLEKYQVLIQLNLYPFDLKENHRAAFQKFIEQGKGWVGIHAAGCAQSNWPWYSKFLGDVTWVSHAEFRGGTLIFEDRGHPATRNMPATLSVKDEWYQFSKSPRANVRVLAKADEAVYKPFNAQGDHPMVWGNPAYPKTLYISIGHDPADWVAPDYVNLVRDAILSAAPVSTGLAMGLEVKGGAGGPLRAYEGRALFGREMGSDGRSGPLSWMDISGRRWLPQGRP